MSGCVCVCASVDGRLNGSERRADTRATTPRHATPNPPAQLDQRMRAHDVLSLLRHIVLRRCKHQPQLGQLSVVESGEVSPWTVGVDVVNVVPAWRAYIHTYIRSAPARTHVNENKRKRLTNTERANERTNECAILQWRQPCARFFRERRVPCVFFVLSVCFVCLCVHEPHTHVRQSRGKAVLPQNLGALNP